MSTLAALQEELGWKPKGVKKLILHNAHVMGAANQTIHTNFAWVKERLCQNDTKAAEKIIKKSPVVKEIVKRSSINMK